MKLLELGDLNRPITIKDTKLIFKNYRQRKVQIQTASLVISNKHLKKN